MKFSNVNGILRPVVLLGDQKDKVRVNFGARKFVYDIDDDIEADDWQQERSFSKIYG